MRCFAQPFVFLLFLFFPPPPKEPGQKSSLTPVALSFNLVVAARVAHALRVTRAPEYDERGVVFLSVLLFSLCPFPLPFVFLANDVFESGGPIKAAKFKRAGNNISPRRCVTLYE